MTTHRPDRPRNLGVRVLSLGESLSRRLSLDVSCLHIRFLDGGGSGALSELLILKRMMYRIQVEAGLDAMPRPCDYFELIGGSGAGG